MQQDADMIERKKKKPFLEVGVMLLALVICAIEYYVLFPIFTAFNYIGSGNILETIMHVVQMVLSFVFKGSLLSFGIVFLIGILVLAGCLLYASRGRIKPLRVSGAFLASIMLLPIAILFIMVASVPSIIITNVAASAKMWMQILTFILDFVTIMSMAFMLILFGSYMFFWYPSIIFDKEGQAFTLGKRLVDKNFRHIAPNVLGFYLFLILSEAALLYFNSAMAASGNGIAKFLVLFLLNWMCKAVAAVAFSRYILCEFIATKQSDVSQSL